MVEGFGCRTLGFRTVGFGVYRAHFLSRNFVIVGKHFFIFKGT